MEKVAFEEQQQAEMNRMEAQAADGGAQILILHPDQLMLSFQVSFWFNWCIGEGKKREGGEPLCHIEDFSLSTQVLEQESDIIRAVFQENACDTSTPLICGARHLESCHRRYKGMVRLQIKITSKQNQLSVIIFNLAHQVRAGWAFLCFVIAVSEKSFKKEKSHITLLPFESLHFKRV